MTRALLGGAILLAYGWFFFGVEIYAAFDTVFHLYFAREFYEALLESLTWPDWDAFPYDGRGTPAFRFYAPVGYLISAALQLLGAPVQVALKGTILLFAVVGAIGVYYWFRRLGLRRERPLGAALFLSSPFLAVHLTRVFFFQNLLAILLFPWVCYGLAHRGRGRKRGGIIAGVTLGVMALTHLPATLMAGYLSVVILTLTRHGRETWSQVLRELLLIVALAAGIAAPYLLPAMAERTTVNFHSHMAIQEIGKPGDFLDDRRIDDLASATASFSGASEFFAPQLHARFRLLLLCVLIGSIPLWTVPATKLSRRFWFCGLIPLPLLVRASLPIWKLLPGIAVLQYSWRWVLPISILLLPGYARVVERGALAHWTRRLLVLAWVMLLIHSHWTGQPLRPSEWQAVANLDFHYPCEYVPVSCSLAAATLQKPLSPRGGLYHRFWGNASMSLQIFDSRRDYARVEVSLATTTIMTCQTHYDPFWIISDRTNERQIEITPYGACGLIQFQLPANCREFLLFRVNSWYRTLGWGAFALTLLLLYLYGFQISTMPSRNSPTKTGDEP